MLSFLFFYSFSSSRTPYLFRPLRTDSTIFTASFESHATNLLCTPLRWSNRRHHSRFLTSKSTMYGARQYALWKDPLRFKKTYDPENVKLFVEKIKEASIAIEPKIDGFACLLEYRRGRLIHLSTKGKRVNLSYSVTIPEKLNIPFSGYIRGELFITHQSFQKINNKRARCFLKTYKISRGVLSSFLLKKKRDIDIDNNVQFFGYYIQPFKYCCNIKSQLDTHLYLKKLGLECNLTPKLKIFTDTKKAMRYMKNIRSNRNICSAPIDGMVVKILRYNCRTSKDLIELYSSLAYCFKFK